MPDRVQQPEGTVRRGVNKKMRHNRGRHVHDSVVVTRRETLSTLIEVDDTEDAFEKRVKALRRLPLRVDRLPRWPGAVDQAIPNRGAIPALRADPPCDVGHDADLVRIDPPTIRRVATRRAVQQGTE